MFTGLVQAIGTVAAVRHEGAVMRLDVDLGDLGSLGNLGGLSRPHAIGDSIALSGVCCTVVGLHEPGGGSRSPAAGAPAAGADRNTVGTIAAFDLTAETLDRTWLGSVQPGDRLNLEPALRAGDPLGGHLVQGHVDGKGAVVEAIDPTAGGELWVRIPTDLLPYCVQKGSVTLDGVSLTIAAERRDEVRIAIIPHTAQITTLGHKKAGDAIHVEVDVLAKYVEKMLSARGFGGAP